MLRPRVSTSAGQSVAGAVVTVLVLDVVEAGVFKDLACAAKAEKAVLLEQARQLSTGVSYCAHQILIPDATYGLPSGPRTTPGGSGFAAPVATAVAWPFACESLRSVWSAMAQCCSALLCPGLLFV